jgi:hypothetical protein
MMDEPRHPRFQPPNPFMQDYMKAFLIDEQIIGSEIALMCVSVAFQVAFYVSVFAIVT